MFAMYFAIRAAQWPEVVAALFDRAARRAERLVVMQAIAHLTRVDDRLLALLWSLAERWGRVVPGGVPGSARLLVNLLSVPEGAPWPCVAALVPVNGQLARATVVPELEFEFEFEFEVEFEDELSEPHAASSAAATTTVATRERVR